MFTLTSATLLPLLLAPLPAFSSPLPPAEDDPHANIPVADAYFPYEQPITLMDAQFFPEYNSTRAAITYGPFLAPPMSENMGMKNFPIMGAKLPCSDCMITYLSATLVYPATSDDMEPEIADADTGMWLHHTVMLSLGVQDSTCPVWPGDGTHKADADEPMAAARFWGSGNERTPTDLTQGGTVMAGLPVTEDTMILLSTELMNLQEEARNASLVITYEFVPGIQEEFKKAVPVWLDIKGLCTDSAVAVPEGHSAIEFVQAEPWEATFEGEILTGFNHLHDGGTKIDVVKNGEVVCEAVAKYTWDSVVVDEEHEHDEDMDMGEDEEEMDIGEDEEEEVEAEEEEHEHDEEEEEEDVVEEEEEEDEEDDEESCPSDKIKRQEDDGHDHVHSTEIWHINSISNCENLGPMVKGDKWSVRAHYNFDEYPAMEHHDGGLEPIMGITMLYVLVN